ncbi:MAG: DDE-type integrase/transposase/recombinase [Actinobacteria bacterium]|nr:DDE-type integrase/transposase/recombinase [Actinomycetota bacterium]MCG2798164.1 DDE-type integrase/transposase/recombinase [Cellulomonas sp.]
MRSHYRRPDPADRLEHVAGDVVQCDLWFPAAKIPTGLREQVAVFPVLVMVAAHSRFITAVMLPSRTTADLLTGMWLLLSQQLGAVPRRLLWDNEAGIGRRGHLAAGLAQFCGTLATRLVQARPFDPETKGVVERANDYLETSFLPGRTFTSGQDFSGQLQHWLTRANQRTVRSLNARPVDLLPVDQAAMLALPPVAPVTGWDVSTRLPRDYYVRLDGNDYSVEPAVKSKAGSAD